MDAEQGRTRRAAIGADDIGIQGDAVTDRNGHVALVDDVMEARRCGPILGEHALSPLFSQKNRNVTSVTERKTYFRHNPSQIKQLILPSLKSKTLAGIAGLFFCLFANF
jgi:hypothetical protein